MLNAVLILVNEHDRNEARLQVLEQLASEELLQLVVASLSSFRFIATAEGVRYSFDMDSFPSVDRAIVLGKYGFQRELECAEVCLRAGGVPVYGTSPRAPYPSNKLGDALLFALNGIGLPRTYFAPKHRLVEEFSEFRQTSAHGEVVCKAVGLAGRGEAVIKPRSVGELADFFVSLPERRHFILQDFVPGLLDFRVWVVGGRVVSATRRILPEGEFRSNSRFGSVAQASPLPAAVEEAACTAAACLSNDVVAFDLLCTPNGDLCYFLESNAPANFSSSPDASAIAKAVLELKSNTRAREVDPGKARGDGLMKPFF